MIPGSLARRYARALLELGQEGNRVEIFGEHLAKLASLMDAIPGGFMALANRSFSQAERLRAIEEIAAQAGMDPEFKNFLCLLVRKERFAALPGIAREYCALSDELLGVVRVAVSTPTPPPEELLRAVEKLLHKKLNKRVVVQGLSNPALLGGMVLEVGHKRFDGSIRRHLEKLREDLIHSPLKH